MSLTVGWAKTKDNMVCVRYYEAWLSAGLLAIHADAHFEWPMDVLMKHMTLLCASFYHLQEFGSSGFFPLFETYPNADGLI